MRYVAILSIVLLPVCAAKEPSPPLEVESTIVPGKLSHTGQPAPTTTPVNTATLNIGAAVAELRSSLSHPLSRGERS